MFDPGTFQEMDAHICSTDPLGFMDYALRLSKTEAGCAVVSGQTAIEGAPVVAVIFNFEVFGGSIGCAEAEKIVRAMEVSATTGADLVSFVASGGARMQEGLLSLMQVAKLVGARSKHKQAARRHISVFCDPCMAGALISFGMLADIRLAEPLARVSFSGARVARVSREHTAESYVMWGQVDEVVHRKRLRVRLAQLLNGRPRSTETGA